jgi:hypothetical protein
MKNTVSTASGAQTGNVPFFSNIEKNERFNSLGHLWNPMFYNIFMLLFGFIIRKTPNG